MTRASGPNEPRRTPEIPLAPTEDPDVLAQARRSPYAPPMPARPPVAPAAPLPSPAHDGAGFAGGPAGMPFAPPSFTQAPLSPPPPTTVPPGGHLAMPEIVRPPLDGVSVAAVATGLLGLGPVAVVLGVLGWRRTHRNWRRSPMIAGIGLGLGVLGTVGWVSLAVVALLGGLGGPDLTAQPGDVAAPRTVHASALDVGNCVQTLPPQQEVGEVHLVPCAQPHLAEVVARTTLDLEVYPGPEDVTAEVEPLCTAIIEEAGHTLEGRLAWSLVPSATGWDAGERAWICLVRSGTGPMTGSLD